MTFEITALCTYGLVFAAVATAALGSICAFCECCCRDEEAVEQRKPVTVHRIEAAEPVVRSRRRPVRAHYELTR